MTRATPEDIANVIKLLERLRTGEMNLIPSVATVSERKQDKGTEMLQRVEGVLSEHFRRMDKPLGDGGPAFPAIYEHSDATSEQHGMSLRDYFAAKELTRVHPGQLLVRDVPEAYDRLAEHCYRMADAMLKARSA